MEHSCSAAVFAVPEETRGRPGQLHANADGLEIILEDGTLLEIYWRCATFSLGGFDGHHLVIEGESRQDVFVHLQTDYKQFCLQEAAIPPDVFRTQIAPLQKTATRRKNWAASLSWVILGSCLACLLVIYLSWGLLLDQAVQRIPISWEVTLGEAAATQFLARNSPIKSGEDFEALNTLFKKLTVASEPEGFSYELHLIEEKEANAFALPGGTIVVHTGLLHESESAEEVAGVLAHEIQHVRGRHGLRRIVGGLGMTAIAAAFIGDLQGLFGIAREAALHLSLRAYDRDQERDADEGAVRLLLKLQINPQAFANFFERLDQKQGDLEQTMSYFSTHPASKDRSQTIRQLKERLAGEQQFLPLDVHFNGSKKAEDE